jgi:uncharacterized Fe-S cluster-containing radical SAM superfamily protein
MALIKALIHSTPGLILFTLLAIAVGIYFEQKYLRPCMTRTDCVSVNYHFTRKCNKTCKFCFHTEKSSYVASEDQMKRGLQLLKKAGMRKINFAGGEPFLYPESLGWLCRYCKEGLGLESVSIITNGTKVTKTLLDKYGTFVDVLGVSCDSFDEKTNVIIGRGTGKNVEQLFRIRDWCKGLGIKFKLNTVVCKLNWQEDMVASKTCSPSAGSVSKCFPSKMRTTPVWRTQSKTPGSGTPEICSLLPISGERSARSISIWNLSPGV